MTITRTRLRCNEKDCPRRDDEDFHKPVCRAIPNVPHSDEAQHQHWPKRSQGGRKVVAILCSYCHDRIDNGPWGNAVEFGVYRIWDVHGHTLLRVSSATAEDVETRASAVAPGASSDGGEAGVGVRLGARSARDALPPSPDVPASEPSLGGDGVGPPSLSPPTISESLKPNGLDLPPEFTFEEWTDLAGMVAGMNKNRQWWAGDLVLAGERFGERATNFWNDLGYRWESLSNAVRVCRRFPLQSGLRHPGLSFAHHAVVYALDDDEAYQPLMDAHHFGWTVKQLREAVHGVKPKTMRYTLSDLREDLAAWPGEPKVRNNARRWAEAWLDYLEAR